MSPYLSLLVLSSSIIGALSVQLGPAAPAVHVRSPEDLIMKEVDGTTLNDENRSFYDSYVEQVYDIQNASQAPAGELESASPPETPSNEEESEAPKSIMFLLLAMATGCLVLGIISRYCRSVPYTVVVFVFGFLLGSSIASKWLPDTSMITTSTLLWVNIDPHLFLLIFLPVLLFGDCINLNTVLVNRVIGQAVLLAGPGVLISAFATGMFLKFFLVPLSPLSEEHWDFNTCMCFGSIISATDPVAVVALLSGLGCSPVLTVQISGESILNDGTAMVLYTLFRNLKAGQNYTPFGLAEFTFRMCVLGPLCGLVVGLIVLLWISHACRRIDPADQTIQLTLTIACAYAAYFIADEVLESSGVLATAVAGYVMASGMWPLVCSAEAMHKVWETIEYLANTLVFFIAGSLLGHAMVNAEELHTANYKILFLMYIFMQVSRAFMLTILYPAMKVLGPIEPKDVLVMHWGGLRGAVALALSVMANNSYDVFPDKKTRGEILFLVSGLVFLTLVLNATTCQYLVNYLGLSAAPEAKEVLLANVEASLVQAAREMYDELLLQDEVRDCVIPEAVLQNITLINPVADTTAAKTVKALSNIIEESGSAALLEGEEANPVSPSSRKSFKRSGTYNADELEAITLNQKSLTKGKMIPRTVSDLPGFSGHEDNTIQAAREVATSVIREVLLQAVKAAYWELMDLGLLPKRSTCAQYLLSSVDMAMIADAIKQPLSDWDALEKILRSRVRKMQWKLNTLLRSDFASSWEELTAYICSAFIEAHTRGQEHIIRYFGGGRTVANVLLESAAQVSRSQSFLTARVSVDARQVANSRQIAQMILVHQAALVEDYVHEGVLLESDAERYLETIQHDLLRLLGDQRFISRKNSFFSKSPSEVSAPGEGDGGNMLRAMIRVARFNKLGHGEDLVEELEFVTSKVLSINIAEDIDGVPRVISRDPLRSPSGFADSYTPGDAQPSSGFFKPMGRGSSEAVLAGRTLPLPQEGGLGFIIKKLDGKVGRVGDHTSRQVSKEFVFGGGRASIPWNIHSGATSPRK